MLDRFALIATLIREALASNEFPREPEPMVMDGAEQVSAYADSGRLDDGIMAVSNLFHAAHATHAIYGARQVIDLGCGPATQLVRIAKLNPDTHFIGVELAPNMIASGQDYLHRNKIHNVEIVEGDITRLDTFADTSVDGVISTMTLHHLPTPEHLKACFEQIRRVLKPGGALYLADFGRLRSHASVRFFAHMHEAYLPPAVVQDYELSLRAAFSPGEYRRLAEGILPAQVRVYMTFLAPFMVIVKTPDRAPPPSLLAGLCQALSPKFRRDLDDLRLFFRLGGLSDLPY